MMLFIQQQHDYTETFNWNNKSDLESTVSQTT